MPQKNVKLNKGKSYEIKEENMRSTYEKRESFLKQGRTDWKAVNSIFLFSRSLHSGYIALYRKPISSINP
jgi:hypothetical protein